VLALMREIFYLNWPWRGMGCARAKRNDRSILAVASTWLSMVHFAPLGVFVPFCSVSHITRIGKPVFQTAAPRQRPGAERRLGIQPWKQYDRIY